MAKTSLALSALVAATSVVQSAHADQIHGARNAVTEVGDTVDATFDRGFLRLKVRRTLHNPGPRHDEGTLFIDMPSGSVATGLRTLGAMAGRPHWFDADLMEAEAAAAKYQELTGIGGYYPKDPALLSWRSQSLLALQVFPVAPLVDKTVEYALLAPAEYSAGRYRYAFGELGLDEARASVRVRPARMGDRVAVGDAFPAGGAAEFVANEQREIQLVAGDPRPFGGELSTTELLSHKALTHYAFELGPEISRVPNDAWVVILIDGSRSLDAEARRMEVRAARAYLANYSTAHVLVASFDRAVRPLGGFSTIPVASAALAGLDLLGQNGSNVDSALAFAESALQSSPKSATRRILLLTDTLVRENLSKEELTDRVGQSGAVLHIGVINGMGSHMARDDEHPWRNVARATGGFVWDAELGAEISDVELTTLVKPWARPTSLDHVVLAGAGLAQAVEADSLAEGERLTDFFVGGRTTPSITVHGELWSKPFEMELESDPVSARRWAALAFGSSLVSEIDESDMMGLARLGGAVSPVTSYLAVEPGVRPSTEGLDYAEQGLSLSGVGEGWGGFGSDHGRLGGSRFDPKRALSELVSNATRGCDVHAVHVGAKLELTLSEIVALSDLAVDIPAADDAHVEKTVQCLRDALWAAELPEQFAKDHAVWDVSTAVLDG